MIVATRNKNGEIDVLTSGGGHDWVLARTSGPNADVLLGRQADEVVTELT